MAKEAAIARLSTADVAMPSKEERAKSKVRGGNKTVYEFDKLEIGKSIAVMNRTAKQLTSTISSVNNGERRIPVLDGKGQPVTEPVKDAAGAVVKDETGKVRTQPRYRVFFAVDCDPAKDPEQAIARIWREA